MADFDRDLQRQLIDAGCYFVRAGKGSHQIWFSPLTGTSQYRLELRVATPPMPS